MVQIQQIAHYGRWYPYDGRIFPYWWYDTFSGRVINIDDVCMDMGYTDSRDVDVVSCMYEVKIPFFQVNIPELELKYAEEFMRTKVSDMMRMSTKEMDYTFGKYIDEYNLITHWYRYELDVLSKEARKWCNDNGILCVG